MEKLRYEKYFENEDLSDFKWIKTVKQIKSFIPTAILTYSICFENSLENLIKEKEEREKLESYIKEFFKVCNGHGKNSIIFCWRETGLIFIVFPVFN